MIMLVCLELVVESDAHQCIPRFVRMEDFAIHEDKNFFSSGDTVTVTGHLQNLMNKNMTVDLGIHSTNIYQNGWHDGLGNYCSVSKGFLQTFGNEGEHFEIIAVGTGSQDPENQEIKPIQLEPNEKRFVVMELKPLKSGFFFLNILQDNQWQDRDRQSYTSSPGSLSFTVHIRDAWTIYDSMFFVLVATSVSTQIVGIAMMGLLLFKKIEFTRFRVLSGLCMSGGGLLMYVLLFWHFG